MKVKVQTFFISLSIFAVVFIYCAMGHYDKMEINMLRWNMPTGTSLDIQC